jgi:hypothetical protein
LFPGGWLAWSSWAESTRTWKPAPSSPRPEWKGAYILAKKAIPKTAPSIREVVRQIATLGGFLGRKGDGEPGVKTLWLGMQRLRDFVEGMEHMRTICNAK